MKFFYQAFLVLSLSLLNMALPLQAQETIATEKLPANVERLLSVLAQPDVQAWLRAHDSVAQTPPVASQGPHSHDVRPSHIFADYVAAVRGHLYGLGSALKSLPAYVERALATIVEDVDESGPLGLLALLVVLAASCYLGGAAYRKATANFARKNSESGGVSTWNILSSKTKAYVLKLGEIAAIGSAGTAVFLALDYWPDVLERIILACLVAYVAWRAVRATSHYLLDSSGGFRIVPLNDRAAGFWTRQVDVLAGTVIFGYATVISICLLRFSDEACEVLAYLMGLIVLILAIYTLHAGEAVEGETQTSGLRRNTLLSLCLVVLWCLWVLGATPVFAIGSIILGLLCAIKLAKACIDHCFGDSGDAVTAPRDSRLTAILIERTIRFALILLALGLAMWAWDVDFVALHSAESRTARVVRGLILAGIILLAANFLWTVLRTLIERQIDRVRNESSDGQQANRFATLLPVLRNFLMAAIAAVAILMALSELGVEVAPLIAGAGIVGVAIGFGAQTLVKDIISGVFYLLDDAFRVGEFIESGSYKGTVESFSLRSVRLRHNRGPIFTVPFGVLGAVQNMSRDWVIEKLKLTITYDSDVEKARKIIKRIGLELAEDPELKSVTLEPLKMQGVDDFDNYGVVLKLKLKTKPGQQFTVRRRAMVLIKKEFEANGIRFASPYVQITGSASSGSDQTLAVATLGSLTKPAPSI